MKIKENEIEKIALQDYMVPKQFRTVEREHFELPHGLKEVPVIIDLSEETIKKLSFPVPRRKQLFGFATAQEKLKPYLEEIKRIHVEPIEGDEYTFTLIIERKKDDLYLITEKELIYLLEGCMRTPAQQQRKSDLLY